MSPEMRYKILYDKFRQYTSLNSYYFQNVPEEIQMRINETVGQFIESIIDISDIEYFPLATIEGVEVLSIDHLYEYYVSPLVYHAFRIELSKMAKQAITIEACKLREGEKNPGDEISRIKMGPETRCTILNDVLCTYISAHRGYCRDVPREDQIRLRKAFERYIKSIVEIDYMETLSINHIFDNYIYHLAKSVVLTEYANILFDRESRPKINDDTTGK